jgi:uncharacterized membrane protein YedE/YeeE
MTVMILIFGFLFGAIIQYARLNKYNVISGLALRENFAVPKAIALAIGVGAILLNIEIGMGMASYHVKPFVLGGIVLGGLLFGAGMAILGYCPGTLAISLGEGSVDALVGIVGGLVAGVIYTLLLPSISGILGPNLGAISLNSLVGSGVVFYLLLFIVGAVFISASFILNRIEKEKDNKWLYAGIALAILNVIVFGGYATNRPIGASTTFPYLADLLTGVTNNTYFEKIQKPGNWELIFLTGSFLAGLIISLIKKDFKIKAVHSNWEKHKGGSVGNRLIWAFIGGFLLIFGARMAGGCTSGHIISGGMQLAISSLVFAVFVFAGLLITGKLFFKK